MTHRPLWCRTPDVEKAFENISGTLLSTPMVLVHDDSKFGVLKKDLEVVGFEYNLDAKFPWWQLDRKLRDIEIYTRTHSRHIDRCMNTCICMSICSQP